MINQREVRTAVSRDSMEVLDIQSSAYYKFVNTSILINKRLEYAKFKKFQKLKNQWKMETKLFSSTNQIYSNRAYKEILLMGRITTPWIIRELKKETGHWFHALNMITGSNPVKPEHRGMIKLMKEDWLQWANEKHII